MVPLSFEATKRVLQPLIDEGLVIEVRHFMAGYEGDEIHPFVHLISNIPTRGGAAGDRTRFAELNQRARAMLDEAGFDNVEIAFHDRPGTVDDS